MWMMLGMFSGVTACGDACEEVATRSGMAVSIPFRLSGSSALVEGRASGSAPLRSTSIRGGSWVGSSTLAAFQSGSSSKSKNRALRPHLAPQCKPSGPCIAVACAPAIGPGDCKHSY